MENYFVNYSAPLSNSSEEYEKPFHEIIREEKQYKKTAKQHGGNIAEIQSVPTGGFPPIYKCTKDDVKHEKNKKKLRGFTTNKTAVSIKEIMSERRDNIPFI